MKSILKCKPMQEYIISDILATPSIVRRLSDLGIIKGEKVMLLGINNGGVRLRVKGSTLLLDAKLCAQLFINEATNELTM